MKSFFRRNRGKCSPFAWFLFGLCCLTLLLLARPSFAAIYYVDADATSGNNDGSSWSDAYTSLAEPLSLRPFRPGDEIWVAEGTYKPTEDGNRSTSFILLTGVSLYGGFAGTETSREARAPSANPTILTGDIGVEGDNSDNSYHVVYSNGMDGTAVLDGFTVTGGNANGYLGEVVTAVQVDRGGGMYNKYSFPTVANCTFSDNFAEMYGGGMSNWESSPVVTSCIFNRNSAADDGGGMSNSESSPRVANCTFSGNSAGNGGGMSNSESSPSVADCTFSGNSAGNGGGMSNSESSPSVADCTFSVNSAAVGGAMNNSYSSPSVTNCTFSGNSAGYGGGMNNSSCSPSVMNCTFSGNSATGYGGGMHNFDLSSPMVTNCIFWGETGGEISNSYIYANPTPFIGYSIVQSGDVGVGTVSSDISEEDPFLVPLADNGGQTWTCSLLPGSSAVDRGVVSVLSGDVQLVPATDQRDIVRPQGHGVDIGAYEVARFIISVSADPGGTVSAEPYGIIADSADFMAFDTPTFVITPEESMDLTGVWLDGVSCDLTAEGATLTLEPLSIDHTLKVTFSIDRHALTVMTEGTGTGTVSPDHGIYVYGTEVSLTATPAESSNFTGWNGVNSSDGATSMVTMTGDKSVTASFALKAFTVTTTAGTGGSVSPASASVTWGLNHKVTITANHGYVVSEVVVDGVPLLGELLTYTFTNVQAAHTLQVKFVPDQAVLDQGGLGELDFTGGGGALDALTGGTASVDLPAGLSGDSFSLAASADFGGFWLEAVRSGDVGTEVASAEPGGEFLCGVSFDVVVSGGSGIGILPVDLELVISEDLLSTRCMEAIVKDESQVGLTEAFLTQVSILKIVSRDTYNLFDVVLNSGSDPLDFFAVSRDEAGNFLVGLGLLVADTAPEGVRAVQALSADGDCRFLVFDGVTDGHYRDPIVAMEKASAVRRDSSGGCSALPLSGLALLLLPLLELLKK